MVTSAEPILGTMHGVSGEIAQEGKPARTFIADTAVGDKEKNVLTLMGNVSVYAPEDSGNVRCDKLVYDANAGVFLANGNVSLKNKDYSLGGFPALNATSDFSEIATPDLFRGGHGR